MSRWKRWDRLTNPDVDLSWREKGLVEKLDRETPKAAQRKAQQAHRDRERGKK